MAISVSGFTTIAIGVEGQVNGQRSRPVINRVMHAALPIPSRCYEQRLPTASQASTVGEAQFQLVV